jgi:signal recognition particle receptor subunit beta
MTTTADRIASLLAHAGLDDLAAAARAEAVRAGDAVCTLAVAGEFKRGKSTLINALIGADVLPVGALPLTAVGTHARFGESVKISVDLRDGRRLDIDPATIADYATERGNPGNERRVAAVIVTAPAELLRVLHLVDTPGIGSAFADVSATARALLAEADAALVVLSAEQPAGRRELDFIRELVAGGLPVLVAENKIDLVPPAERAEVVEFVREQVRDLDIDVPVFPLSAEQARRARRAGDLPALDASGLPALEEALIAFVGENGAGVRARGCGRRLALLIDHVLARLELERQANPLTRQWREQRRVALRRHVEVALFGERRDARSAIRAGTRDLIAKLSLEAPEFALVGRLEAIAANLPPRRRGQSVRSWAAEAEAFCATECRAAVDCWSDAERETLTAAARQLTADWPARGIDLLAPILGEFPPPPAPAVKFPPPVIDLPPLRRAPAVLLPGAAGRWQVRRRLRRSLRDSLLAMLQARRAAIEAGIATALQRADEEFRRRLGEAAERIIAAGTADRTPVAEDRDPIIIELRRLRSALLEDAGFRPESIR